MSKPASLPALVGRTLSWLTGLGRRSIENPKIPLTGQTLEKWLGGSRSYAGVNVTEGTALNYSTVKACVAILAESVAVLPLGMYERLPGGGRRRAESHPADFLLHQQPNPEMTVAVWKEVGQTHLGISGNAYSLIERDSGGRAVALWPLSPSDVSAERSKQTGTLLYRVRSDGRPFYGSRRGAPQGSTFTLAQEEMLHVPGFGWDGVQGFSPIALARKAIGLGLAFEEFAASALENGAWLGHVLEHPEELGEDAYARLRQSIKDRHSGVANAWNPAILEDGLKLHQLGMPGDDALFLSVRLFQKREIASWYRIPPHMVADLEKGASFASIEQQNLAFVMFTLQVWLSKWEQECTRKLAGDLRVEEAGRYFAAFNADAFLRGATLDRYQAYKIGREGGWLNVNEIRAKENQNPVEGGEEYLKPLNMGTLGKPDPQPAAAPFPAAEKSEEPEEEEEEEDAEALASRRAGLVALAEGVSSGRISFEAGLVAGRGMLAPAALAGLLGEASGRAPAPQPLRLALEFPAAGLHLTGLPEPKVDVRVAASPPVVVPAPQVRIEAAAPVVVPAPLVRVEAPPAPKPAEPSAGSRRVEFQRDESGRITSATLKPEARKE